MVIGFIEEIQYVAENEFPEVNAFLVLIELATLRVSEREHGMLFRLLGGSTATVVSFETLFPGIDAHFGGVEADPIIEMDFLDPGVDTVRPRTTEIINDFIPEDEECFTIQIAPIDIPGLRELFMCDFVDMSTTPPTNYSCGHTICIKDDDSKIITI